MIISHAISSLDPAAGGPPQVVVRLAAAQASMGHSVRVVSATPKDRQDAVSEMLGPVPGIDAVEFVVTATPAWSAAIQEADVMHVHGVWEGMVRRSTGIARKTSTPFVITPHGMLDPWSLQQKALKKRIALMLYHRRMLNAAMFLHALNADEVDLLRPLGLRCPVEVVANGVFLDEIEPLPEPGGFYADHPELDGRPFILFLSRLHYKKGLDILAGAFGEIAGRLKDIHLVVAGPDGGAQAGFEQQVQTLGLKDRVHVVGPIYGGAKYQALVDAACFCLPSRQEGFSIAILEALASGCPVVITENCHFPEVASNDAGAVCKLSPQAVAQSLLTVLEDTSKAAQLGSNARSLVSGSFTWQAIAKSMLKAYEQHL